MVEEARAARVRQELRAVADEAAGGDAVLEPDAPRPVVDHLGHGALAGAELLGHGADELLGDVHHEVLHRLEGLAALFLGDDLGLAHFQLEALTPHHLDQDGELELSRPGPPELTGQAGLLAADAAVGPRPLPAPPARLRGGTDRPSL